MCKCTILDANFTKQRPILEIDFLLDSGATLNFLNEDIWNELKYNSPNLKLTKSTKTPTAANTTKTQTLGIIHLNLTPESISNYRHNPQPIINIFCIIQCNHNILETPSFEEYIETINVNTNKLTINISTDINNEIIFFQNTTKEYPYYSRAYPVCNRETHYFEPNQHKYLTLPIPIFKRIEKSNGKILYGSLHYFEPFNNYQMLSFTDIKDLTKENQKFVDIYLINKKIIKLF